MKANNLKARKCLRRGRIGQLFKQQQTNAGLYIRCTGVLSQLMEEMSEELIIEEKGQTSRFEQSGYSELVEHTVPRIQGLNLRYKIGDQLQLNCSSNGNSPVPAPYLGKHTLLF